MTKGHTGWSTGWSTGYRKWTHQGRSLLVFDDSHEQRVERQLPPQHQLLSRHNEVARRDGRSVLLLLLKLFLLEGI